MTSLLGARKRAEEFSAAVEGHTPPSSLRPELVELVGVVGALRAAAPPVPRPEFSAGLRERLLAEAEIALATDDVLRLPPRRSGARERRLALVASSVVLVGGTAGMASASQEALPGDALYPIKRGIERVQADVGTGSTDKGQALLEQADGRLVEVQRLLDEPRGSTHVPGTVNEFTAQVEEGAALLLGSFEESRNPAVVDELRGFTADALAVLEGLAEVAPADAQDELARAAATLLDVDQRATDACSACAPELPTLQLPDMFLPSSEVEPALEATQGTGTGNHQPLLPGVVSGQPDQGGIPGGPAQGTEGPTQPGVPALPEDTGTGTPGGAGDVVDGAEGATGGLPGEADDPVDELLPEELDELPSPTTDPLQGGEADGEGTGVPDGLTGGGSEDSGSEGSGSEGSGSEASGSEASGSEASGSEASGSEDDGTNPLLP